MTANLTAEVISPDHRAELEWIAAELQRPDLTPHRRFELLEISWEIADQYSCDPRLCE